MLARGGSSRRGGWARLAGRWQIGNGSRGRVGFFMRSSAAAARRLSAAAEAAALCGSSSQSKLAARGSMRNIFDIFLPYLA
jgi:hypothetical protein